MSDPNELTEEQIAHAEAALEANDGDQTTEAI